MKIIILSKRFYQSLTVAAIAVIILTGCGKTIGISETKLPKPDWPIKVDMTQQEIEVAASVTNPMVAGGGILGVIITSSIDRNKNENAEAAIASMRDLLIEYKIAGRFYELLESSDAISALSTEKSLEMSMEHGRDYSTNPLKRGQFIVTPRVEFSNDMSTLWVTLNVNGQFRMKKAGPATIVFMGCTNTYMCWMSRQQVMIEKIMLQYGSSSASQS